MQYIVLKIFHFGYKELCNGQNNNIIGWSIFFVFLLGQSLKSWENL